MLPNLLNSPMGPHATPKRSSNHTPFGFVIPPLAGSMPPGRRAKKGLDVGRLEDLPFFEGLCFAGEFGKIAKGN
jgi:hypothetical protein